MKRDEYWQQRMEALNEAELKKGEAYIKQQSIEYEKSLARIKQETESWYGRLAKNNGVSMAEARKLLSSNELKEFHWDVEEYIKRGRENAVDQRWMKELENASAKVHISRLEEIELKTRQEIELLTARRLKGTTDVLGDIYQDGYYKGIYEVQRGIGQGLPFAKLDVRKIDKVLAKPWAPDGRNFSARIWANRDKLVAELHTSLTQDVIRGGNLDQVISEFAHKMNVSKSAAERLIRTEAAFFSGQSRLDGYKETGVKYYKYVATMDSRTSDICKDMEGKVIPIAEAKAGVNYPPLHAYCRSTTIPHYDDEADDVDNAHEVAEEETYEEWAEEHVPRDTTEPDTPASVTPPVVKKEGPELNEPPPVGDSIRRFNPKAPYHIDLQDVTDDTLEVITETNRRIAREGWKESREILVAINDNGEILKELKGSINKVIFDDSLDKLLRKASPSSMIITHNHPKGSRINIHDMRNLALYESISHIIAVGHDGGVSAIGSAKKYVDVIIFDQLFRKITPTVYAQLEFDTNYVKMSVSEQKAYFEHLVMMTLIKELGWEYVEDFSSSRTGNWGIR